MIKCVALVGNPNTGKTTFFNNATGQNYHIGNWHGVTIDPVMYKVKSSEFSVFDLAGTYSLSAYSLEEWLTSNFILKYKMPIYNICEQNNLRRNLMLTLQLLELGCEVSMVVNNFGKKANFDIDKLSQLLGCQVLNIDFFDKKQVRKTFESKTNTSISNVVDYLSSTLFVKVLQLLRQYEVDLSKLDKINSNYCANSNCSIDKVPKSKKTTTTLNKNTNDKISCPSDCANFSKCNISNNSSKLLSKDKKNSKILKNSVNSYDELPKQDKKFIDTFVTIRLIEGNYDYINLYNINDSDIEYLHNLITDEVVEQIYSLRYQKIDDILSKCNYNTIDVIDTKQNNIKHINLSKKFKTNNFNYTLDKILLNKYLAIPIFLLIVLFVFYITFGSVGAFISDVLQRLLTAISVPIVNMIEATNVPFLKSLFVDGILGGVGSILTFLPQVLLLFLFLTILEESGYMARLAYLLEGICNKIGLSGKSVFTFLMGYGCTATALLTAENLDNKSARLKTILATPYMACSAKLPVFAVLGGAFFGACNVLVIFLLYIMSAIIGIVMVNILDKTIIPNKGNSFLLEFPPYRVPKTKILCKSVIKNTGHFLQRVAGYILVFSILIWFLQNFTLSLKFINNDNDTSILQAVSQILAPLFAPLGFGEWGAVSALLAGLIAKELIVSSIGIINNVGVTNVDELVGTSIMSAGSVICFDSASVLSFLTFCLLYTPCIATISSMRSIIGGKWTAFSVVSQIIIAYVCAYFVYKIALIFINYNFFVSIFILTSIILLCICSVYLILFFSKNCKNCIKNRNK